MTAVFLDSVGLLALWDGSDQWHDAAEAAFQRGAHADVFGHVNPFGSNDTFVLAFPRIPLRKTLNRTTLRLDPAPVEHARDEPFLAQAPRLAGSAMLALLHLETNSFAGHTGGEV
jgi:hypothetical protein